MPEGDGGGGDEEIEEGVWVEALNPDSHFNYRGLDNKTEPYRKHRSNGHLYGCFFDIPNCKANILIATTRLENKLNAFHARVKVSYRLPDAEDWKIEFVNSKGMTIVKTYKYDDSVRFEIMDDGWGGVNALFITNKAEVELGVGVP